MSKIEVNTVAPQCGTTLTLGESGDTVTLGTGASQSGFGRTGTVDWQTGSIKTGDFTAVNGEGYFINTTSGEITMTMPSGSAGAIVSIQDYNATFDSNACVIAPASGEKINGGSADGPLRLIIEGQGLTFVYVDGTVGWKTVQENEFVGSGSSFITATGGTITTSGDDKIHTFTGPGTFCVAAIGQCGANNLVSYVVVAGGGGAGNQVNGNGGVGGGGAGGFRETKSPATPYTASPLDGYSTPGNRITVTATAFPITVGAGGATQPTSPGAKGNPGSNSIFSTITSAGGGGSGASASPNFEPGLPGGSGGGASQTGGPPFSGGTGNTPPTTPPQGNDGGDTTNAAPNFSGSGGGGATAAGQGNGSTAGGNGGAGATTSISASPTAYAGGGGGGVYQAGTSGTGGAGGGGAGGAPNANAAGTAGTANTGGGAGGASTNASGTPVLGSAGGSGVVIIRYKFQ